MSVFKKAGSFILDLVETVVIALAIFVLIYLFLFQPHQVSGSSMYPNFEDGEYLLTDKISYRLREPKRGDVVIFTAPQDTEHDYIKRIIGMPNESVKVESGKIFINGAILNETYLPSHFSTFPGAFTAQGQTIFVPADQYFVLGDNRNNSSDSRAWGFVPKKNLVGKISFRYWPVDHLGKIQAANY